MRTIGLDIVRGLAVLLVLFRHGISENILQKAGWMGVDLFFVLSGYLVSGIVFKEFLKEGCFNFKRFFIRRGFKIYPAFYIFLLISLLIQYFEHHITYEVRFILAEVFFLQSYLPHVWTHTWSIAVEEHFYLAIGIVAFYRIRFLKSITSHMLLWCLSAGLLITLVWRVIYCYPHRNDDAFSFFQTHLRMDGVLIGIMISYMKHFTSAHLFKKKNAALLLLIMTILISLPFVFNGGSYFMSTAGLTFMNLGFGILVWFASDWELNQGKTWRTGWNILARAVAFIGIHSYSIYLWHLLVLQESNHWGMGDQQQLAYILVSIAVGVISSYLIERPFLRLRDRWSFVKNIAG